MFNFRRYRLQLSYSSRRQSMALLQLQEGLKISVYQGSFVCQYQASYIYYCFSLSLSSPHTLHTLIHRASETDLISHHVTPGTCVLSLHFTHRNCLIAIATKTQATSTIVQSYPASSGLQSSWSYPTLLHSRADFNQEIFVAHDSCR